MALREGLLKQSHGKENITKISDLLYLDGFTSRILKKFYDCLLNETLPTTPERKKIEKLCKPSFQDDNNINTISGLIMNTNAISWTQINKEKKVLAWESYYGNFGRLQSVKLQSHLEAILAKLPQGMTYYFIYISKPYHFRKK